VPRKAEQPTGFAARLKTLREAAGLSQQQLADRVGLHKFSIAKLEQGIQEPTWPNVLLIAQALGVGCADFMAEPGSEPVRHVGRGRPAKAEADVAEERPKPSGEKKAKGQRRPPA